MLARRSFERARAGVLVRGRWEQLSWLVGRPGFYANNGSRSILLRAGASVVALSRTETPELTALAGRFPGVLVVSKGDVSKDADNKVSSSYRALRRDRG